MMKQIAPVSLVVLLIHASPCAAQVNVDLNAGTASAPSLYFNADTTTGLWQASSSNHTLNFSTDGAEVAAFDKYGNFNLFNSTTGYQIGALTVLDFPDGDTSSIAVGASALAAQNTTNSDNTAIGYDALTSMTNGTDNIGIGPYALSQDTGSTNAAIGPYAGEYISTGSENMAIGYEAMTGISGTPLTGNYNTAIGTQALGALQGATYQDTGIGYEAGRYISTGQYNVAIGVQALNGSSGNPLTGNGNLGIGSGALTSIQGAATENVAIGLQALENSTTASYNTAIGTAAMAGTSANPLTGNGENAAVGWLALSSITGTAGGNTSVGYATLLDDTAGGNNTALGWLALSSNTTGNDSTAIGYYALGNSTGSPNTAIGFEAGNAITSGTDNTLVGFQAGVDVTGSHNIILGEDPSGAITSGSSNILVGNSLSKVTKTSSNQIDIGDVIVVTGAGTPSTSNTTIEGTLTVSGGLSGATGIFSSGQLQCGGSNCSNNTGSTTLDYCPYKGNLKTTAEYGTYTIPSGCLTATLTSMYIGGTAAQSAAANTLYYVYLINVSGTTYLDLETTGHATDSTTGIEVENGNSARTLVGMIETSGPKKVFTGGQTYTAGDTNTVATWDNRRPTTTTCSFTTTTSIMSAGEINTQDRCLFMSWGDAASFSSEQHGYNNTAGGACTTLLELDGNSSGVSVSVWAIQEPTAGYYMALVAPGAYTPTEGYHYTDLYGEVTAGTTGTWIGNERTEVLSVQ
jgi:hypothetical protein